MFDKFSRSININDEIALSSEFNGINPEQVENALKQMGSGPVLVRISSPGGSLPAGIQIYELLKHHSGKVSTHIVGEAASIASVIALAGERRTMLPSARIMIHCAHCVSYGNKSDHEQTVEVLRAHDEVLRGIYQDETNADEDRLDQWMDSGRDNWFDAKAALKVGLVHEVTRQVALAAKKTPKLDRYRKIAEAVKQRSPSFQIAASKNRPSLAQIAGMVAATKKRHGWD